nr:hypothetical protein [Allomuricauda sp.]
MKQILDYLTWIDFIAAGVWVLLTIIMVWLLFRIYKKTGMANGHFYLGIFLLVIVWLYPLYTYFFNQLEVGAAGNIFTLLVTLKYRSGLKGLNRNLSKYLIPQIVWLVAATLYVGLQILVKYQS